MVRPVLCSDIVMLILHPILTIVGQPPVTFFFLMVLLCHGVVVCNLLWQPPLVRLSTWLHQGLPRGIVVAYVVT
jgi:hypothetical protein